MANTKEALNIDSILNDAVGKLEDRLAEVQAELKPLRDEERELAEAVQRLTGSWPSSYEPPRTAQRVMASPPSRRNGTATATTRMSPEERQAQVIEYINDHPDGVTAKAIADNLNPPVSTATVIKAVDALLEAGTIKTNGREKAARRLLPI